MAESPLERLRELCLAHPDTSERLSHGEPTWFVRDKKTFVMFANHHHDDRLAFWCAAAPGAQEVLAAAKPEQFFVPPYVGHRGWLGAWLDVAVDWDELAGLVAEAYATVASTMLWRPAAFMMGPSRLARRPGGEPGRSGTDALGRAAALRSGDARPAWATDGARPVARRRRGRPTGVSSWKP